MSQTPKLETIIEGGVEQRLSNFYTAIPGRVMSFNATTQTADVEPLIWERVIGETGELQEQGGWGIPDCPVLYPGGAGNGMRITWPLKENDIVLLVVCSLDLDKWKATGITQHVDPAGDRNDMHNAICIPSLHSLNSTPTTVPTDALVLHGDKIYLGGPGASGSNKEIVVQSALADYMNALDSAISALQSAGGSSLIAKLGLDALKAALAALNAGQGWKAGTSKGRSE